LLEVCNKDFGRVFDGRAIEACTNQDVDRHGVEPTPKECLDRLMVAILPRVFNISIPVGQQQLC
jgi:hypothetical protein